MFNITSSGLKSRYGMQLTFLLIGISVLVVTGIVSYKAPRGDVSDRRLIAGSLWSIGWILASIAFKAASLK